MRAGTAESASILTTVRRGREEEDRELESGNTLGPYHLDALIGEGGMGLVFRATHEWSGNVVAVKVLKRELTQDDTFKKRFKQEVRASGEIRNRHLVPIVEAGESDGRQYLVVGYVAGGTLEDRLKEKGQLSVDDALRVAENLAEGLDALHAAGVVHRDIKSSNILFDTDGAAMLTDFGLAKGRAYTVLTRPGQVVGTLDYLAPELIKGKPATALTDIYALGCTVFECVTGDTPFGDKTLFQVGLAHLEEPPPDPTVARPDLPPELGRAILTALAKEPEQRPQSAGAYVSILRGFAGALQG